MFYKDYLNRLKLDIKSQTAAVKTLLISRRQESYSINKISKDFGASFGSRFTIIDNKGVVIADSYLSSEETIQLENHINRNEIQEAKRIGHGWSERFSTTIKKKILYYAEYVENNNFNGFIRVAIPIDSLSAISKNFGKSLSVVILVIFLSSLLIALLAFNLISKPIRILVQKADQMASGNFSMKILVDKKDEVGELAASLNKMSNNIKYRISEIIKNNSKFEAVLLAMFEGVMVINSDGSIELMNDSLKKMTGVEIDPLGKRPIEVIRNSAIQDVSEDVLEMKHPDVITREELILPFKKNLLIHATPVFNKGEILGSVIVFSDITELRRLELVRRDFVANVSHELRTPVSNIQGYAETLLDGALKDNNAHDFVDIIHTEAKRLSFLINDILSLSKLESESFNLNIEDKVDLKDLVHKAILKLSHDIKLKNINTINEITDNIKISCDKGMITQVLINLLDNAIKYSPEGATVKISVEKLDDKSIKVYVKDQGIGIPHKDIARIFERFYRVDKSRGKDSGGTGLGLSIVKHIVQLHGGEVFVESQEGYGSNFSFVLPN
jgi:two-component system phosphate regulon sensor histidine kinase PhoR